MKISHLIASSALLFGLVSCATTESEVSSTTATATVTAMTSPADENPFLEVSPLPFEAPDFTRIENEHFLPALLKGMEIQAQEMQEIANNPESPTFENTLVAMERSGELLSRVQRVFSNMSSAHTNEVIQETQAEVAPKFAEHSDNIYLNSALFERVQYLHENKNDLGLDSESVRLIDRYYERFVRAGALLTDEQQDRIRELNSEMSSLATKWQQNMLAITRERAVIVDDPELLDGLGTSGIAAAKEAAESRGHEGKYLLNITNTTRQPVLTNLNNREMRQRVWEASAYRGLGRDGGIDNSDMILRIAQIRAERAEIMGYENYAAYELEPNAAQNPENAYGILKDMIPAVMKNVEIEAQDIREMMNELGYDHDLAPWDWEYFAEKVRAAKYDIDPDEVKMYFELDRVLEDGVFYAMKRLYGITFEERHDIPVYHPEVRVFNVYDHDGEQLGLFYGDFFSRDSKRGGAWMSSYVVQNHLGEQKPVILNVLNISPPAEGEPALISFSNATTMFHEMGHAVHGLFSDVTYPSLAGTAVPRDFVEFPSTFEEDWAILPEVLENYAIHYETGETIPQELLDRVLAAQNFNMGFNTLEYAAAALLDLDWHTLTLDEIPDNIEEFENESLARHGVDYAAAPPRYKTAYFNHIWPGGYSAQYYAYIWSEVFAADAFAYMQERGGLTRENGDHYRKHILSRGGTAEPMELYINFTGSEPGVEALLRRRGLAE